VAVRFAVVVAALAESNVHGDDESVVRADV